jgi:hypothetical protein
VSAYGPWSEPASGTTAGAGTVEYGPWSAPVAGTTAAEPGGQTPRNVRIGAEPLGLRLVGTQRVARVYLGGVLLWADA